MKSIWMEDIKRPHFEQLEGDMKTDVLIIGGGMAGIMCAYMLKKSGISNILVEADEICHGVTGNTTAKITLEHGLIYDKIIRKYGQEAAACYIKAQQTAIDYFGEICKGIDCDYKNSDSYVYSVNNREEIEREVEAYHRLGCSVEFCESANIPVKIAGAVKVPNQAQFNPLKFCFSIASELDIYENTKVLELFKGGAVTNRGKIYAKKIIVATHFPFLNKHGGYFLKMYQHRSYAIALEKTKLPDGMYVDADIKGLSFREYNGLLILGGGSHRTGKKGGNWQELRAFAKENYPDAKEIAFWATQDCMTLDSIPYIGKYSKNTQDLYVATGFNKWGMTNSLISAIILTDMIMGKESDFAKVFDPDRSILHTQLFANIAETTINLLTPTVPRCPHLGCALKYNPYERSWDCPCHGSRFTESGKLIENPATGDKNGLQ